MAQNLPDLIHGHAMKLRRGGLVGPGRAHFEVESFTAQIWALQISGTRSPTTPGYGAGPILTLLGDDPPLQPRCDDPIKVRQQLFALHRGLRRGLQRRWRFLLSLTCGARLEGRSQRRSSWDSSAKHSSRLKTIGSRDVAPKLMPGITKVWETDK